MVFGCFGKSSINVAPLEGDEVGDLVPHHGKKGPGTGRMDDIRPVDSTPGRDGLHSAPSPGQGSVDAVSRTGLHSAPKTGQASATAPQGLHQATAQKATPTGHRAAPELGEFYVEQKGGPTAADVDEYLEGTFGSKLVKELRSTEWAERVRGIEALQGLVMKTTAAMNTSPAERLALFRACITVLARLLQDKIVPVYLPALQLLVDLYVPSFLAPLPNATVPRAALVHFAGQLVYRAGSSNVRAREESGAAYLHLARCEHAGPAAVCPHALRPLSNSKSQHAAVGRLELLRSLVNEFGVSASTGLELKQVLAFVVPLCESASEKSRDAAFSVLAACHGAHPEETLAALHELNPNVAAVLRLKVSPDSEGETDKSQALAISGRRLPPLGGAADGAMPMHGVESLGAQSTPPFAEARARARMTSQELGARSPPRGHGAKGALPRTKQGRSPASAARTSQRQRVQEPTQFVSPPSGGAATSSEGESERGRYLFEMDDETLMEEILAAGA